MSENKNSFAKKSPLRRWKIQKKKKIKEEFYEFGFMEASGPDGNSFYMF